MFSNWLEFNQNHTAATIALAATSSPALFHRKRLLLLLGGAE